MRMAKQNGRVIMRLEITQKAIDSFTTSAGARGMTHIATTSRIIEWFTQQSDEVQASVLGNHPTPPSGDELTRMILERVRDSHRS